jgi:hypothetical protein
MNAQTVLALVLGSAAIAGDLRRKVICNRICLAALVGGLVCHTAKHGWYELANSGGGALNPRRRLIPDTPAIVPGSWLTLLAGS